jgi:hypothetical protein
VPDSKDNRSLYAVVDAKLAAIAAAAEPPPTWYGEWSKLGPQSTHETRPAVYQAVRDTGSVPPEAGMFLVAWTLGLISYTRAQEALRDLEDELEQLQRKHGVADDWAGGVDEPDEVREMKRRYRDARHRLYATVLEEFGERELARLFRENDDEFQDVYEVGRQYFHWPEDHGGGEDDIWLDPLRDAGEPEDVIWLDALREAVADSIEPESLIRPPLDLRYHQEQGFWDVCVYATPFELVGGARDGDIVAPGFHVDLEQLRSTFDTITASGWNALGLTSVEGPYVYLEGTFQGREVYLQVLATAPDDEQPGLKVDTMFYRDTDDSGSDGG